MGSPISKLRQDATEDKEVPNRSLPTTPILTPKIPRSDCSNFDPRSPSTNIVRTPIEFTPISKSDQMKTQLKLLEIDPRSPTVEFTRTPILVASKSSKSDSALLLQDDVRKNVLCFNALKALKDENEKTPKPKLIESSVRIVKTIEKRKSFVGLLETNLDYLETDLDFAASKNDKNGILPVSENENIDPKSLTTDFLRKVKEIDSDVEKINEFLIQSSYEKTCKIISEENLEENCQKINDELNKNYDFSKTNENFSDETKEFVENNIDFCGISENLVRIGSHEVIKTFEDTNGELSDKKARLVGKSEDLAGNNKNNETFVSKCGNSIGENNEDDLLIDVSQSGKNADFTEEIAMLVPSQNFNKVLAPITDKSTASLNRRPLRDTNLGTKNSIKLKVNDKPTKISKIPIIKNKVIMGKSQPCENTPPKSNLGTKKSRTKANWDSDNTLII